ncbi:hypothetical protein VP01_3207g3, partial [Puccinia sorghi]
PKVKACTHCLSRLDKKGPLFTCHTLSHPNQTKIQLGCYSVTYHPVKVPNKAMCKCCLLFLPSVRTKYIRDLEEYRDQLLEFLTTTDGGEILPDSATIITYIHREVQQASIVKRRQDMRSKEPTHTKAPGKKW